MPISLPRTPGGIARAVDSAASLSGLLYRNGSRNNLMSPRELRVLGTVHITVLQGPAGTGKSTAAEYFRMEARKRGLHVVYIKAESTHRAEPYGVVRDIFFEIVGLPRPSSLNAENCSPDFLARMGAPVPESKKLKGGRTKASVLETVRATLTDQVKGVAVVLCCVVQCCVVCVVLYVLCGVVKLM